jgi:hypothetical protein
MGAWGYGIRQDDVVCDIIGSFEDVLKSGESVAGATKVVWSTYPDHRTDSDDGPLFWIALAEAQWTYGRVEARVLKHVKDDLLAGRSLIPWREDQRGLVRRRASLEKFIKRISKRNPRPKKPPKPPRFAPRSHEFRPGDCLSIRLSNGQYGAALVLAEAEVPKNDDDLREYLGGSEMLLIGILYYLSKKKPSLKFFNRRKWLVLSHHNWAEEKPKMIQWFGHDGFREAKKRFQVIGQVELHKSDPRESNSYGGWETMASGEQMILQHKWDRTSPSKRPKPDS